MHLETCTWAAKVMNSYPTGKISVHAGGIWMLSLRKNWVRSCFLAVAIVLPAAAQRDPLFKTEILPVLEKNCVGCHGPNQKMARLDLSSFAGMMEGSSSGPVIAPGKPERSLMWKLIENDTMPQGGKLSHADKQLIKSYIQYGRFPVATPEEEAAALARENARITDKDRSWWSFRTPVKPAVPTVKNAAQVKTPIDAFVLAEL